MTAGARRLVLLVALALPGCAPGPAPEPLRFAPVRAHPPSPRSSLPAGLAPATRIVLTFDDGPSNERFAALGTHPDGTPRTPTEAVLDRLRAEGIAAAFFVLTGPDLAFPGRRLAKGETALGLHTLRRSVREGHVLACHWGGRYGSQLRGHPASLALPAYDADGDGEIDRARGAGSALESELLACMARVGEALAAEGRAGERVDFVRPPLWRFRDGDRDARPTYAALGLRMVLADERVPDGAMTRGLAWFGEEMVERVVERVRRGDAHVVIALHDVNRRTAAGLPALLERLRERLAQEGLMEDAAWRFARDAAEVRAALREQGREADGLGASAAR